MGLIRLTLALAVVAAHTSGSIHFVPFFGGEGVTPVTLFFVISGFYMALVHEDKYKSHAKLFYRKRFLRLFPMYWIILTPTASLALIYSLAVNPIGPFADLAGNDGGRSLIGALSLLWNIPLFGTDLLTLYHMEIGDRAPLFIPATWSLGSELLFYVMSPLLLLRTRTVLIALIAAIGLRYAILTAADFTWTPWKYYFPPSTACYFLAGALSFRIWRHHGASATKIVKSSLALTVTLYLAFPLLIAFALPLFGTAKILLVILLCLGMPVLFGATKDWRADRLVGELSYPVYLCHSAILLFWAPLRHFISVEAKFAFVSVAAILAAIVVIRIERLVLDRLRSGSRLSVASLPQ